MYQMERKGCTPNVLMHNSLIDGLLKVKEFAMLAQMEERGCIPDVCTYTILMDSLLKAKEVSKVLAMLDQMEKRGRTLNVCTYNCLIDGLLKAKEGGTALPMLAQMEERGCTLDMHMYNCLIDGLLKAKEVSKAVTMGGFDGGERMHPKCLHLQQPDRWPTEGQASRQDSSHVGSDRGEGMHPDVCTYNCLIDDLLKAREVGRARAMLAEMKERDTPHVMELA
ncbi:hypothetical protein L7F22_025104 [Adiantum nelumboides]|nr:hypothetical protein [Adiantum nelumboides]